MSLINDITKLILTDIRNRLHPEIVEAGECYVSWVRAGLVDYTIDELHATLTALRDAQIGQRGPEPVGRRLGIRAQDR